MFTGIVEEIGEVKRINRYGGSAAVFEIKAVKSCAGINLGDSVAVNGVCLTVAEKKPGVLIFQVLPQTLKVTNLGIVKVNESVNLERALKLGDRLSGHFVTGHVDCRGIIRKKGYRAGNLCFEICVPAEFMGYIFPRGSVTVDGISLTVVGKKSNTFTFYVIPHTLNNTTLKLKKVSEAVNIEFDILVKGKGLANGH